MRIALLREHAENKVYSRLRDDAADRARSLFAQQLSSGTEVTFLAERAGVPAGILRCIDSTGSPLLYPARHAYVSSVYVVPRARRQGVLHALLGEAVRWCRERGLDEIRLHSASDNPLSNATWDALGFEVVEHLRVRAVDAR
jgi:ribosomal protein S18 acetylase RimI-like enzyme